MNLRKLMLHPLPLSLVAAALLHAAALAAFATVPTRGERIAAAWSAKPNYTYYAQAASADQARPG